jgi:transmembrane sensor
MADGPTQQDGVRERAEDEAASWFLRLSENPDDSRLRDELAIWREQSALHQEAWDRTCLAYDMFGKAPASHEEYWRPYVSGRKATAAPVDARGRRSSSSARRSADRRRFHVAAAIAALAACVALIVLPGLLVRLNADVATSTAELRVLVLDDGSRVHLAPETAVKIAFTDGERRMRLLSGQAFFEVARDDARPFEVMCGDVATTVLGTKFDVRLDDDGVSVAVKEGHVRVTDLRRSPSAARDLLAGDLLRLGPPGGAPVSSMLTTIPPSDVGDWAEGRFIVRHQPVSEIVNRLRNYYQGIIVMNDGAFANLQVSGVYDPNEPVATLDKLARLHGSTVRQLSPWLVLVTPF